MCSHRYLYYKPTNNQSAYDDGFNAGQGLWMNDRNNPHKEGSEDYQTWEKGYQDGKKYGLHLISDHV